MHPLTSFTSLTGVRIESFAAGLSVLALAAKSSETFLCQQAQTL
jgi:hypothetical protein